MDEPKWLSVADVRNIQEEEVLHSSDIKGIRDIGLLESAVARPQNLFLYSDASTTVFDLAATYAEGIAANHPFIDANKRTGLTSAGLFLKKNGFELGLLEQNDRSMIVNLVKGNVSREEFSDMLKRNSTPLWDSQGDDTPPAVETKPIEVPKTSPLGEIAHSFNDIGKKTGTLGGLLFGTSAGALMLADGANAAEAGAAAYETVVPYGETQVDLLEGDVAAASRSATVETISNGAGIVCAAAGTILAPGVGTVAGGVGCSVGAGFLADMLLPKTDKAVNERMLAEITQYLEDNPPEMVRKNMEGSPQSRSILNSHMNIALNQVVDK